MSDRADDATIQADLIRGVARLRELALQARDLAELTREPLACAGLQEHAADLEQHADGVAAQLAILTGTSCPVPKLGAIRPPRKKAAGGATLVQQPTRKRRG